MNALMLAGGKAIIGRECGREPQLAQILADYLDSMSIHTRCAYRSDLANFARYVGADNALEAVCSMIEAGQGEANAMVSGYRAEMNRRGLAPATINRKLAAVRAAVRLARMAGIISWTLEVPGERMKSYRDTRGPGRVGYQKMLAGMDESNRPREARDLAILHLLYDLALRRGEVARLDLPDVDLAAGTVKILGKGRKEPEKLAMPEETAQALALWIEKRGEEPGPLFVNYDRAGKKTGDGRLSSDGIHEMVKWRGEKVGLRVRPHGLRHAAITEALELTNGNLAAVQDFSRHSSSEILRRYDDNRQGRGAEVARLVAKAAAL